jgi:AmiR/NasT family two-component response regulator
MVGAAEVSHLHAALVSRDVIGQAKGILMHRENLTGLQAFEALTRASQSTQVKLVDVARWVVDFHEEQLKR